MIMRRIASWLAILTASLAVGAAGAQQYPSKPVKIIVGFAPGRLYAAPHARELHRQCERVQTVLRSPERHHAHRAALARALRGRGTPFGSGEDAPGAGGAREEGPGQARLCFERK